MGNLKPPLGWGNDNITKFLDMARGNSFATFKTLTDEFSHLVKIYDLFSSALDSLEQTDRQFEVLFFFKAKSALMGAIQLAVNTQVPEAFAVLRMALESSLYGLFIFKDNNFPELANIWLKRHDSVQDMKKVKDKFKIGEMFTLLQSLDSELHGQVKKLYDKTIDHGAHPNEKSMTLSLKHTGDEKLSKIHFRYLTDDSTLIGLGLKSSAQVGLVCLKILELIFSGEFKMAGLSEQLKEVEKLTTF